MENTVETNIYLKLAQARVEIQKRCTKKSGKNKFANFEYFELKDFLTTATEELLKQGLCALFNIYKNINNETGLVNEVAELVITDGKSNVVFSTPAVEANVKGANDIQNLGSKHTYLKRYLYLNALELSENDGVGATIGKDEEPTKKIAYATESQLKTIRGLYTSEELNAMLGRMNKKLEEITLQEASKLINARKDKANGSN